VTNQHDTTNCPFCDGPIEPDKDRSGVLYCPQCDDCVAFKPPKLETMRVLDKDAIAESPGLTARFAVMVSGKAEALELLLRWQRPG
jgi:hypothetical protein